MRMFSEDDLLPISALQHLVFCERQWALIHLEGVWEENSLTVEGKYLHNRADDAETEVRGDLRIARGLRLKSLRLGLTGKADVVEFHSGVPMPVEYKRGKPKPDNCDKVQICAQALCLEEMLGVNIPIGAIFYGKPRRRLEVAFDTVLRAETEKTAERLHELMHAGKTPKAKYGKRCRRCSLLELCMPKAVSSRMRVEEYLTGALSEITGGTE